MKNLFILLILCAPVLAFAGMDEVVGQIESYIGSLERASGVLALGFELIFRLIPSEKPLSFAHLFAKILRSTCLVAEKLANLLDKVLPQNVKTPE